jgi:hypothetical protein
MTMTNHRQEVKHKGLLKNGRNKLLATKITLFCYKIVDTTFSPAPYKRICGCAANAK